MFSTQKPLSCIFIPVIGIAEASVLTSSCWILEEKQLPQSIIGPISLIQYFVTS